MNMSCLIVDDDEMSRLMLRDEISSFANCHMAANGIEGLVLFEKAAKSNNPYRLICVDLLMPQMNGLALIRKIREIEKTHPSLHGVHTKIVVISGSHSVWDKAELMLENLCDAYIEKPFNRNSLIAAFQSIL